MKNFVQLCLSLAVVSTLLIVSSQSFAGQNADNNAVVSTELQQGATVNVESQELLKAAGPSSVMSSACFNREWACNVTKANCWSGGGQGACVKDPTFPCSTAFPWKATCLW